MTCLNITLKGLYHDFKEIGGVVVMLLVSFVPAVIVCLSSHWVPDTPKWVIAWALCVLAALLFGVTFGNNLYRAWRNCDADQIIAGSHSGERELIAAEMRDIDAKLTKCDYTDIKVRGKDVDRFFELRRRFHRT